MTDHIKIRSEHSAKDLINISKVVLPLAKQLLGTHGFYMIELLQNWRLIVGDNLAKYAVPLKISFKKDQRKNGCLILATISGAFAMEIKQKQQHILHHINTFFGYEAVTDLKIMQTADDNILFESKKPSENLQKNVVSAKEENYITELTKDINSPELREIMQRLGHEVVSQNKK